MNDFLDDLFISWLSAGVTFFIFELVVEFFVSNTQTIKTLIGYAVAAGLLMALSKIWLASLKEKSTDPKSLFWLEVGSETTTVSLGIFLIQLLIGSEQNAISVIFATIITAFLASLILTWWRARKKRIDLS